MVEFRFVDGGRDAILVEYNLPGLAARERTSADKAEVDELEVRAAFQSSYTGGTHIRVTLDRRTGYIDYGFGLLEHPRYQQGRVRWTHHMTGPCQEFVPPGQVF